MDPLTAISLAGNIIQFIDVAHKILSGAKQLYSSTTGATDENNELENLTKHLQQLANRCRYEGSSLPRKSGSRLDDQSESLLKDLGQQCDKVAEELLEALNSIKVKERGRPWKSTLQALRTVWEKDRINNLQRRLDRISRQLIDGISLEQGEEINRMLRDMAVENSRLEGSRSQEIDDLKQDFNSAFQELKKSIQDERDMTRAWLSLSDTARRGQGYFAEQFILQQLRFHSIDHRHDSIPSHHSNTFSWIFDESKPSNPNLPSVKFVDWAKHENGLYWVSGKPGSGKSTLMKFIATHQTTLRHLQEWTGEKKLIVARFYFWNASTHRSEKSQEGLLRAILYQILRQCPEMIQVAYHEEWVMAKSDPMSLRDSRDELLSTPSLLAALRNITGSLSASNIKFCFFIDGLDEYAGRPADIIELVETLKSIHNVKTCVSSRPWNAFEESFGRDSAWKLYMHELTRGDIRVYVEDLLVENRRFRELKETDPQCPDFFWYIVSEAKGVFLWVFLVVRSLLEGLTNSDRIADLRRRVEETPKDLEEFFEKILFSTDGIYQKKSAQAFIITMKASQTLPLMAYWVLDQEDPNYFFSMDRQIPSAETIQSRLAQMKKRIMTLTKGLLEAYQWPRFRYADDGDYDGNYHHGDDNMFHWDVRFLHRTVKDYLETSNAELMLENWSGKGFNADLEICKAIGAMAKMASEAAFRPGRLQRRPDIDVLFRCFMDHAQRLDQGSTKQAVVSIMDELQKSLQSVVHPHRKELYQYAAGESFKDMPSLSGKEIDLDLSIIGFAIFAGMPNYVAEKFTLDPLLCDKVSQHFPAIVLASMVFIHKALPVHLTVLQLLLNHGLDPNRGFNNESEWRIFLESGSIDEDEESYDCVKVLLEHGAAWSQECIIEERNGKLTRSAAVEILRECFDAERFGVLQDIAERVQKERAGRKKLKTKLAQLGVKELRHIRGWIKPK